MVLLVHKLNHGWSVVEPFVDIGCTIRCRSESISLILENSGAPGLIRAEANNKLYLLGAQIDCAAKQSSKNNQIILCAHAPVANPIRVSFRTIKLRVLRNNKIGRLGH